MTDRCVAMGCCCCLTCDLMGEGDADDGLLILIVLIILHDSLSVCTNPMDTNNIERTLI